MLEDVDVFVFDMQDVGCRIYNLRLHDGKTVCARQNNWKDGGCL